MYYIINQKFIIMDIIKSHELVSSSDKCLNVTTINKNHNDAEMFSFTYMRTSFDCIDCGGLIVIINEHGGEFEIDEEKDLLKIIK